MPYVIDVNVFINWYTKFDADWVFVGKQNDCLLVPFHVYFYIGAVQIDKIIQQTEKQ